MKWSRFTEEQVIGILKEAEAGAVTDGRARGRLARTGVAGFLPERAQHNADTDSYVCLKCKRIEPTCAPHAVRPGRVMTRHRARRRDRRPADIASDSPARVRQGGGEHEQACGAELPLQVNRGTS